MNFATRPGLGASAENRELTVVTWCRGDEQVWLVQSDVDRALWIDTLSTDERGRAHGSLLSCVDDFLITAVLMTVKGVSLALKGVWECADMGLAGPDIDSAADIYGHQCRGCDRIVFYQRQYAENQIKTW